MTDILGQFREDDMPPSRVDIEQAVRSGRRGRRLRAGFAVGGVVIALAAAAGGTAPLWLSALRGTQTPPGDGTCATAPPLPTPTPTDWEYFDLLRFEVDADDVAGYHVEQYLTTRYYQSVELTTAAHDRTVRVLLHAAGAEPHYRTVGRAVPYDPATGTPTQPVGDEPAFLLPGSVEGEGIAWQWAPGAWVFVTAMLSEADPAGDPQGPLSIVREVAQGLQLGVGLPISAPLAMPAPGCTRLTYIDMIYSVEAGPPMTGEPGAPTAITFGFDTDVDAEQRSPLIVGQAHGPGIGVLVHRPPSPDPFETGPHVTEEGDLEAGVDGLRLQIHRRDPWNWLGGPRAGEDPPVLATPRQVYDSIIFYPGARQSMEAWGPPISS